MKLIEYEIIDHGMEHSQYFQGCGTSFTRFTHVWTGITWPARFWAHAKREIDKFDRMVERKWMEGRES